MSTGIKDIIICVLLFCILLLACGLMSAEDKIKELRVELRRVNLDKAGLNGLCGALIDQKYDKPYNTLNYEVNLPDAMTVAIEVNYSKNHILSPVQGYELVRIHKEAIAEITLEEWTKYGEWK